MADKAMTMTERLRNPQWIEGQVKLDTDFTVRTMMEAADEIDKLQAFCREHIKSALGGASAVSE